MNNELSQIFKENKKRKNIDVISISSMNNKDIKELMIKDITGAESKNNDEEIIKIGF